MHSRVRISTAFLHCRSFAILPAHPRRPCARGLRRGSGGRDGRLPGGPRGPGGLDARLEHVLSHPYRGRVLNIHPALPRTFPGTRATERAYEAYQRGEIDHTGVMEHHAPDEGVDDGPVVVQREVPILPAETLADLETRIHSVEHEIYVLAMARVLDQLDSNGGPVARS